MISPRNRSVIKGLFFLVFLTLLFLAIAGSFWAHREVVKDNKKKLEYIAGILKSYFELSYLQHEVTLSTVGDRLIDFVGPDKEAKRLAYANKAVRLNQDLLAFGLAMPDGEVVVFSGSQPGDSLPHLMRSENTRRSFELTLKADGIKVGETYYFENVNDWIIPLRCPIFDQEGNLIAVNTTALKYKSLIMGFERLGFDENFIIHLTNEDFNTTQIYHPCDPEILKDVLNRSSDIYEDLQVQDSVNGLAYYTAFSSVDNKKYLGVKDVISNANQGLYVSVSNDVILEEYWQTLWAIIAVYLVVNMITGGLFAFFSRKEKDYYREIQLEREKTLEIIKNSPTIIVGFNGQLKITFANPSAVDISGYSLNHLEGKDATEIIFEGRQLHEILAGNPASLKKEYEMVLTNKEGEVKNVVWIFKEVSIANERVIIAFGKDITSQKLTEKQIADSEANLRALFESTNSIIGLFDTDKRLIEFNQSFYHYAQHTDGIKLEKGMNVMDHMKDPSIADEFHSFQSRALDGEKFKETLEYPLLDGGSLYFLFTYNPIYSSGEIIGISMFVEDITELKLSQRELERYNEELTSLVKERTVELEKKNKELELGNNWLEETLRDLSNTQEQLVQAEKMASLGVLAAGIAHEINNPLNFIKNGISGLAMKIEEKDSQFKEELMPIIHVIDDGVKRTAKIVKSLSHFSRSNQKFDEDCNIHDIIENCLMILHNRIKARVKVVKDYEEEDMIIKGSEGKLHQAVLNIISNAESAIKDVGEIVIKTKRRKKELEIMIQDNGVGIKEDHVQKISDPFFTTKPTGEGTGLGLFITYNIIRDHQGKVKVDSTEGKGTTFTIVLPLNRE